MKLRFFLFPFFIFGIIFLSGCGIDKNLTDVSKVTVYKSFSCNCCEGFIEELKRQGFNVNTINTKDMNSIKDKYNISSDMESCHTTVLTKDNKEYFIEGHVPMKAIEKLLEEQPDISGIALPGMPKGSPGMPGTKTEKFKIYALKDGESSKFMEI